MKGKLPELKSKPIIGVPEEEWHKWTTKHLSNLEKLQLARIALSKDKGYAERAHAKVDWKKVNQAKDNKAIHKHRMKKIYAWSLTGEFIAEYESEMEAGRQLGVAQGNINSAIDNGRIRKGYRFTTVFKAPSPYPVK